MNLFSLTVLFLLGLITPSLCLSPIVDLDNYARKHQKDITPFVSDTDIIERFFPQRVDQYDASNTQNFLQRYFSIENYYQIGGPVFIFIGGFQPIESNTHFNYTFARDLAIEHGGIVIAIENRFFGLSRPTPDLSLDSLRFLTIEQSLADYSILIRYIKDYVALVGTTRIFVGGVNSGATLATWLTQAIPSLATATWASSAPLKTSIEFENYYNDVGETLNRTDSECYNRIEKAFSEMRRLLKWGRTRVLEKMFNLQHPISRIKNRSLDREMLMYILSGHFTTVVEYYDVPTIRYVCDAFIKNDNVTALQAFANFVHSTYESEDFTINTSFKSLVNGYSETSWESPAALGPRQMTYIACNQLSRFPTTSVQPTPFGDISLSLSTKFCRAALSNDFTDEYITSQNEIVNLWYNGQTPNVNYVYFTNGGIDPFRLYGVKDNLNLYSPTVVIPDYGKSRDSLSAQPGDSYELNMARYTLNQLVRERQ